MSRVMYVTYVGTDVMGTKCVITATKTMEDAVPVIEKGNAAPSAANVFPSVQVIRRA